MSENEPQIETSKQPAESGAALERDEQIEPMESASARTINAAMSTLDQLGYAERQGANEMNAGIGTDTIYTGLSFRKPLDSFTSGESPTLYLGILKPAGDSGNTFTLEIDQRDPAAGQFLAFNRPLGESGNLRLGASLDLKTSPIPTAYELAIRGELPVLGGEAGLTISAAPSTQEEPAYFETLATYIRRF